MLGRMGSKSGQIHEVVLVKTEASVISSKIRGHLAEPGLIKISFCVVAVKNETVTVKQLTVPLQAPTLHNIHRKSLK